NACNDLLDVHIASGRGASPAGYHGGSVVTYQQLSDDVMQIAGALRACGVQPGDCVVIRLLNRPHFISIFLAILRIGAVAVPTPPLLRSREIGAIIESVEPVLLVYYPVT